MFRSIAAHTRHIFRPCVHRLSVSNSSYSRGSLVAHHYTVDYESKYAEKMRQLAAEKGLSMNELKEMAMKSQKEEIRRRRQEREEQMAIHVVEQEDSTDKSTSRSSSAPLLDKSRKDSSPVKPLSSILNFTQVLSTHHTSEQIAHLWNGFHMSRSGGTGRGYLSASIPLSLYNKMSTVAEKYPTFVIPIRRPRNSVPAPSITGGNEDAYEFYFLQWDFHGAPPVPTADPFAKVPTSENSNPKLSTILFTPLEEYKLRNTFATPYLVLTNYTDLASTHSQVLLRGEITPRSNSGKFMLSQEDAQRLSMAIQKFYLWGDGGGEGEKLLKIFHERPDEFRWEDLLKLADWDV
ncbi:hypothetical protein Agabi119p4_1218 [Agaricus bisporus var. burnettii]|uniref:ATP11-domain-containing protein n=1 Tax=Agaricus bisporus var. burnettii TaxID=192524 RepID=A0A8H7FC01_AGABI|nr:hypothetical protein Agabi119p4_1218 [Agaricus bisporus var. burnettii]